MKAFTSILFSAVLMLFFASCKYDVAVNPWEQHPVTGQLPTITQVDPPAAIPGVNTITITGTNFDGVSMTGGILFNSATPEIIQKTSTSIIVRRPNLVSENSTLKIISNDIYNVVAYDQPYRVDAVTELYGTNAGNLDISIVAADAQENVYFIETLSKNITKILPSGEQSVIGVAARAPSDAVIGPDGKLYLPGNAIRMDVVDLQSGDISTIRTPQGKPIRFGDFDSEGYFYAGGLRTSILIKNPDSTEFVINTDFYSDEEIIGVRVYNNSLYIASRESASDTTATIYRHALTGAGTLGSQELVLDFESDPNLAVTGELRAMNFSSDGKLYVGVDSRLTMLVINPSTGQWDIFYKNILAPYCKQFFWGSGTYLYIVIGNNSTSSAQVQPWRIHRVDMGTVSAP